MELNTVPAAKSLLVVSTLPPAGNTRSSTAEGAPMGSQLKPLLQAVGPVPVVPPPTQVLVTARAGAGVSTVAPSASSAPRRSGHRQAGGADLAWMPPAGPATAPSRSESIVMRETGRSATHCLASKTVRHMRPPQWPARRHP